MPKIHLHGDITLYPVKSKAPVKADRKKLHVLQASGITGNRHEVISGKESISRWTDKDGKEFVSCVKDFRLQHIGGDSEHGVQEVEAGTYEIKREMEHDPFKNELKIVID